MGCCNQAPKGGTGKLSYLLGLVAVLFVGILVLAAVLANRAVLKTRPRACFLCLSLGAKTGVS